MNKKARIRSFKMLYCILATRERQFLQKLFVTLAVFLFTTLLPANGIAQSASTCQQAFMIVKTAEKYHYKPRPVDDRFSELVFTKFIELLDPSGIFFTRDEVVQLEASKFALDEEILNKKCVFIKEVTKLYNRKLSFADSLINSFKDKKFNFNQADTLTFRKDEIYVGHEQLIDRWRKLVKLQVLSSYLSNA
ncbi:MAG: hypothetical protein KAT68_02960, partial [Bacteroidales bacterium]|nr:hypothetical protein [Bacteroidales bacterium]